MKKKIVHSIILARGGSKGIKNKNLIKIKNRPLIFWSINKSLESKEINFTWLSSDNPKILKTAKILGAKIIKRPKSISNDKASSESAWQHAIRYIKNKHEIDVVVGIQPTSPIRGHGDFDKAIKLYNKKKFDSLFSSTKIQDVNIWKYKNNKLIANYNFKKRKRRQEIINNYLENGSFYIFNANKFEKSNNRLFGKIGTYEMDKKYSFQIDDYIDLKIIKSLI
ncbi:acylneuraminate cytidylyltransferase family protein [Candidatus Pelagibacter sp.]|nr:acylneuraminate cytidylyltransferase family protein [Candidatus Pelagibacter sp.]